MEQTIDPHNYERNYICTIKSIENSNITDENKNLILRFKDACVRDGLSKPRIIKLLITLKNIAKILDQDLVQKFSKATKKDIEKLVPIIQERNDYSIYTKNDYKVIIKRFYKWLKGKEEFYPDEVNGLRLM